MRWSPQRSSDPPRRYGEDDNVVRQSATGIGIVAAASIVLAGLGFAAAVVVSWLF